jgi:hypothetical protein
MLMMGAGWRTLRRISFPNSNLNKRLGFFENYGCVRNFSLSKSIANAELAASKEKRDQVVSKLLHDPSNVALQIQAKIYTEETAILERRAEEERQEERRKHSLSSFVSVPICGIDCDV